jgi:hypothetical protein
MQVMGVQMKKMGREKDWLSWREDAFREVEEAVAKVSAEPVPDPFEEDWWATQMGSGTEVLGSS